ncbi:universal stress protein [Streptomyces sp. NPDC094032]|uniref:universal stress protein n=1 Tax=Streptomyces sp. NPDC094032 TaxID=3155308 RepID=UPI00333400A1
MTQDIVVGLDGTEQAVAAAEWAAEEALLRGTGLQLVHVLEPSPDVLVPMVSREPVESWALDLLARTAAGLREHRPGLAVTTRVLPSGPVPSLVAAADRSALLVLGSRALGGVTGYLVGSVGMTVAGRVEQPIVLVRAGSAARRGPVVAGVDVRQPADGILRFACEEAAWRRGSLEVVYVQELPLYASLGPAMVPDVRPAVTPEIRHSLEELLESWRAKYPDVAVNGRVLIGSAGEELVRIAGDAALVAVGRRTRKSVLGGSIGSVAHAVMHHSPAPVAVVPHD